MWPVSPGRLEPGPWSWAAAWEWPGWRRWSPVWMRNVRTWRRFALPSLIANFGEPLLYLLVLGYGLGQRFVFGLYPELPTNLSIRDIHVVHRDAASDDVAVREDIRFPIQEQLIVELYSR